MRVQKRLVTCAIVWLALTCSAATSVAYQPAHTPEQAVAAEHPTSEQAAEGEHDEGLMPTVARLANFAMLVGLLAYFLRSPLAGYLQSRGDHIRAELVQAGEMRRASEAQLAEVARRMEALPGELDALRTRGAEDIANEEARLTAVTESERERLLEQMRREMDLQVRVARTRLHNEAAELATQIARRQIESAINPDDHLRLLDRYATQIGAPR